MLVSSSVVIHHNDNSGSGLLLSGNNYVFTSPVWFIHGTRQGKDVFSVSLQCAGNTINKRDAILLAIFPISKLVTTVQKMLRDVSFPDIESFDDVTKLCSIAVLQIKGTPLQCRY